MESEISHSELLAVLKKSNSSSAPGSTGFSFSFYKFFWADLGTFITNCANFSFENNMLPKSQRYGIIKLLPKGSKDQKYLKNWRPLTMLNCIYKLISGVIANRINEKLHLIIENDQCGFVRGRFIGEAIRSTFDTLEWAKRHTKKGLVLLIDFFKAFDSVNFKYIQKTFKFFGFKNNIIKWIGILLNNFSASINHAGNLSEMFDILTGCKQGDPVSPLIFILAIEILCIRLRTDQKLKGYKIDTLEIFLSLYADDCSIFLEHSAENLRYCVKIMDDFYLLSGLRMQLEKTQIIVIGNGNEPIENICPELNLIWEQDFTLLGVKFDANLEKMQENFTAKMDDIKNVISNWQYRLLSPLGRCCVAKSLLLSKLANLALVLPSLSNSMLKSIEGIIYNFIWKGPDKVARDDAKRHILKGGLSMPDIKKSWMAFKLTWFCRMFHSTAKWKDIFEVLLKKVNILYNAENFFHLGTDEYKEISKKIESVFWSENFSVIKPFMRDLISQSPEKIIKCVIWGSDFFSRNGNLCKIRQFPTIGLHIQYPMDIIVVDEGVGRYLTNIEFQQRYGCLNEIEYTSIKHVITVAMQKVNYNLIRADFRDIQFPFVPSFIQLINLSKKGCSQWTKIIGCKSVSTNSRNFETKWELSLGAIQGVYFWDRCYRNVNNIFFNSKIKWFYYQIVRGCLKTNRIVCHIKRNVRPECTFCSSDVESILHLFWYCHISNNFIKECMQFAQNEMPIFWQELTSRQFIFGTSDSICAPVNYFILHVKYFIWLQRCFKKLPLINGFKSWFKREMRIDLNHVERGKLNFLTDILSNDERNDNFIFI